MAVTRASLTNAGFQYRSPEGPGAGFVSNTAVKVQVLSEIKLSCTPSERGFSSSYFRDPLFHARGKVHPFFPAVTGAALPLC